MKQWIIALELTALLQLPAAATELKPDVINAATLTGKLPSEDRINPLAVNRAVRFHLSKIYKATHGSLLSRNNCS
jgi:hypothetical protein